MTVQATVVSVGTTATPLNPAPGSSKDQQPGSSIAVYNAGSSTVYLGGSDVATATGYPLPAGAQIALDLTGLPQWSSPDSPATMADEKVYGVVASGSVNVNVLATGV